jgi:cell division protein FtsW (lipid II flippase)
MKNFTILLVCLCLLIFLPIAKGAETEPAVKGATLTDESAKTALNAAVAEYNALSKKEKKSRFREAKKLMRDYKAEKKAGKESDIETNQILLAIIAIILPPLAIYLKQRELGWQFWASLGLMVTGIIFLSALPFLWILAAALALLVVFDVL